MQASVEDVRTIVCVMLAAMRHLRRRLQQRADRARDAGRELGSLRVLGFSSGEISSILVGGMAVEVVIAVPIGLYLGRSWARLSWACVDQEKFRWEVYVAPTHVRPRGAGGDPRGRGERAVGAPERRPARSDRCAEDAGVSHGRLEAIGGVAADRRRTSRSGRTRRRSRPRRCCLRTGDDERRRSRERRRKLMRAAPAEPSSPSSSSPRPSRSCRRSGRAPSRWTSRRQRGAASSSRSRRRGSRAGQGPVRRLRARCRARCRGQLLKAGDAVARRTGRRGDRSAPRRRSSTPRTRSEAQARLSAAMSALGQAEAQRGRATGGGGPGSRGAVARPRRWPRGARFPRSSWTAAEFEVRMRSEELSSAAFAVKVAAEQVRAARARRRRGTTSRDRHMDVLAPTAGRVLRVLLESEGVVQAGTPLLEVGNRRPDGARRQSAHHRTRVRVQPGTPVTVQGWGGDRNLTARVHQVEPSGVHEAVRARRGGAAGERRRHLRRSATVTGPRWATGYRIEARFVLWQGEDVGRRSRRALAFRHGDGWGVFRVVGGRRE